MPNGSSQIVQKLWNYCNVLRDDGLSYGDYVEQLTYLLFLKMAHEQTLPPWRKPSIIPKGYDWPALDSRDGDELETHYRHTLEALGKQGGMLGIIFRKAQNKIQDPAKLKRLISDLIDNETVDLARRGREGRCLRGAAGEERAGREGRRGTILHASAADPRDRGCGAPAARRDDLRPGLRHRRLPPRRPRLHRPRRTPPSTRTRRST